MLFVVLFCLRLPIAFALGFSGFIGYWMLKGFDVALARLGIAGYTTMMSFVLSPIAVFILMGEFVVISGLGSDLFEAGWRWLGRTPGSLAIGSVFACAVFAAMCGVSVAAAVTIGMVAIPEMLKRGYDKGLATGVVAAGGTLSILIPPSVTFILYGAVAEESIGKLFMAGVFPGIVLTILFSIYVLIFAIRKPELAPAAGRVPMKEKFYSLRGIWAVIILIAAVLGTIYVGVATPTEAAAVGALAAMLIAISYRKLTWSKLWTSLLRTAEASGYIFIIVVFAMYFGVYLTLTGATDQFINFLVSLPVNPWIVMVGINLLLMVLGCFLDPVTIILLTVPMLHSIIIKLGFDGIWFGVIVVINMELGFLTPPVGLNLFAIKGICPEVPFDTILRGSVPFMFLDILCIIIISIFPQIALWLPSMMK